MTCSMMRVVDRYPPCPASCRDGRRVECVRFRWQSVSTRRGSRSPSSAPRCWSRRCAFACRCLVVRRGASLTLTPSRLLHTILLPTITSRPFRCAPPYLASHHLTSLHTRLALPGCRNGLSANFYPWHPGAQRFLSPGARSYPW